MVRHALGARAPQGARMKAIRLGFPAAIAVLVLVLLAIGHFVYAYPLSVVAFPLCIGLFVLATAAIALGAEYKATRGAADPAHVAPPDVQPQHLPPPGAPSQDEPEGLLLQWNTWVQFASIAGLLVLCWVGGFIPGIVIFVCAYLWRAGWRPVVALLYGLAAGLAIWLLFDLLFFTPLPFWPIFMR
jgi:hypothetical protein